MRRGVRPLAKGGQRLCFIAEGIERWESILRKDITRAALHEGGYYAERDARQRGPVLRQPQRCRFNLLFEQLACGGELRSDALDPRREMILRRA